MTLHSPPRNLFWFWLAKSSTTTIRATIDRITTFKAVCFKFSMQDFAPAFHCQFLRSAQSCGMIGVVECNLIWLKLFSHIHSHTAQHFERRLVTASFSLGACHKSLCQLWWSVSRIFANYADHCPICAATCDCVGDYDVDTEQKKN